MRRSRPEKSAGLLLRAAVGFLLLWGAAFCTPSREERCGKGFTYEDAGCYKSGSGGGTPGAGDADADGDGDDSGAATPKWIGASCSCTGDGCAVMGMPIPTGGTITGCENVPTGVAGTVLACMRSYSGDTSTSTYFANGYCTLTATKCQGNATLCQMAQVGSYDAMTGCPAGSVMLSSSGQLDTPAGSATIDSKMCTASCVKNGDCRDGETDPVFDNEKTQYQCMKKDGKAFCYDPRNLKGDYTVTSRNRQP